MTKPERCEPLLFEGMINANGTEEVKSQIKIKPYMTYEVGMNGYQWLEHSNTWEYMEEFQSEDSIFFNWFRIERAFFDMLRLTFWPVIGTILSGIFLLKSKSYKDDWIRGLWVLASAMTLIIGIGAAYGLEYGSKWWLTRIAAPGYYMGFICLMSYIFKEKNTYNHKYKIIGQVIVCFLMVFGPLSNMVLVARNLMLTNGGLTGCMKLFIDMYSLAPDVFY